MLPAIKLTLDNHRVYLLGSELFVIYQDNASVCKATSLTEIGKIKNSSSPNTMRDRVQVWSDQCNDGHPLSPEFCSVTSSFVIVFDAMIWIITIGSKRSTNLIGAFPVVNVNLSYIVLLNLKTAVEALLQYK
ncbi:hypothetical protein Plhal304r1_c006g0025141 [Plasmopara halstedii]